MVQYISPQQGIKEQVNHLENRLVALANKMRARPDRIRVDAAYRIPFRDQAMVDETKGIEVTALNGADAIHQIISGLTTIRIEAGKQNPRETLRAPGAVALPEDWLNELEALNALKSEIERLVEQIEDKYQRMLVWRSMRYLSSLQTMRHAWIVSGPATVRFYWDAVPSVQPRTAGELITSYKETLTKLYGYVPGLGEMASDDKALKFVFGINELSKLDPRERVAVFRPGQPHVRARLTFIDSIPPVIRAAPTPIVYSADDPVPHITPLSNWEPTQRQAQRSIRAKIEVEPFVEALYLHRYLQPFRFGKAAAG